MVRLPSSDRRVSPTMCSTSGKGLQPHSQCEDALLADSALLLISNLKFMPAFLPASHSAPFLPHAPSPSASQCPQLEAAQGDALMASPDSFVPTPPFPCLPHALPLYRLVANGAEPARVLSINGAEYKQNKAFISQAVISLLIYFTVHRLFICFHVFSAGVICGLE